VFLELYKTYVRPHLEFAVQAWSPWTVADREVLEQVQKKAVKQISGLRSTDYEGRLRELGLTTLEECRHQADMVMTYKILTGKEDVEPNIWFKTAAEAARVTRASADARNVRISHGRLDVRRHFFSIRCTEPWNSIPSEIKELKTVNSFKHAYAKFRLNKD